MDEIQIMDLFHKWGSERHQFSLQELSTVFELTIEELLNKLNEWNHHLSNTFIIDANTLKIENFPLFLQNLRQNYGIKKCEYCYYKYEIKHPLYYRCNKKGMLVNKNRIISLDPRMKKKCPFFTWSQMVSPLWALFNDSTTWISARNCGLHSLRDFPPHLMNLEALILAENPISSLEGLPTKFPNLTALELYDLDIEDWKYFPRNLPNLVYLNLSSNHLTSLDFLPATFPKLEIMHLGRNNLTDLTGFPPNLPHLRRLFLDHNNLSSLNKLPSNLPRLEQITIQKNNLSTLRGFPKNLEKLESINLSYNSLTTLEGLPIDLPKLQEIAFEGNPIVSLTGITRDITEQIIYSIEKICYPPAYVDFSGTSGTNIDSSNWDFSPYKFSIQGQELLKNCCEEITGENLSLVFEYYAKPLRTLIKNVIQTEKISKNEEDRILYEANYEELNLIENLLPNTHPLCKKILKKFALSIGNGFQILR